MSGSLNLSDHQKLSITYRVEPGCLGPDGGNVADEFCAVAQQEFKSLDADCVIWNIVARHDKSLPEMQFHVLGKMLTEAQASKYLAGFEKDLDELEGHLSDKLATLIDNFMGH
jgi:hypothetical protein